MTCMADFFGGLSSGNIRFTDARINGGGPLPTSLSGPEGINGDPDGRYNFNDSLLSSIAPYAGPKDGRMGSDRNYQQIPHRKQYPVPKIFLPEPAWNSSETFDMSHPIDMGDLVFIVNVHYKQYLLEGKLASTDHAQDNTMPNYNAFANVCTVNYLLAGIMAYTEKYIDSEADAISQASERHAWYKLMFCLNMDLELRRLRSKYNGLDNTNLQLVLLKIIEIKNMLQCVIRDKIKPHGICATSEKQGGQHETGYKPVQAAASFYVTLTVDGQNRDLVNIWRSVDVAGGDLLMLQLNYVQVPQKYVLNHYYKGWIQRKVDGLDRCFQLVPGVRRTAFKPPKIAANVQPQNPTPFYWEEHVAPALLTNARDTKTLQLFNSAMDNRECGYWHIGQAYSMKQQFDSNAVPHDDMAMTRGPIMQVNFAPVWEAMQYNFAHNLQLGSKDTDAEFVSMYNLQGSIHYVFLLRAMQAGSRDVAVDAIDQYRAFCDRLLPENAGAQVIPVDEQPGDGGQQGGGGGDEGGAHDPMVEVADMRLRTSQPLVPEVQRFKKARVTGTQELEATSVQALAASDADMQEVSATPAAPVTAAAESAWDFEKDLAAIFTEDTRTDEGSGSKARPKAKQAKGT